MILRNGVSTAAAFTDSYYYGYYYLPHSFGSGVRRPLL